MRMRIFENISRIHFIGVGGISLSALAKLSFFNGISVTGSDSSFSHTVLSLMEIGITVWIGSAPSLIGKPDIVVFSSAVPNNDVELSYCREQGFQIYERHAFLQLVAQQFSTTVAIAGTHGKTTATAFCSQVLKKAKYDFCAHIGGEVIGTGNLLYCGNDYFLTEACEYKRSFLSLFPSLSVILNAERDHPDTYPTEKDLNDAFFDFATKNSKMCIVYDGSDFFKKRLARENGILTFGFDAESTYRISDIFEYKPAYYGFFVSYLGTPLLDVRLPVPGYHNIYNAASAIAVGNTLHVPPTVIADGIESFRGVKRRFEKKGVLHGAAVFHDYAHHPAEIIATVALGRRLTKKKLYVVFQPHTFSRTRLLLNEFSTCFSDADYVFVVKEYAAREKKEQGDSAYTLFKNLIHKNAFYYNETLSLAKRLTSVLREGDTLLVLGAGDIESLCDLLV